MLIQKDEQGNWRLKGVSWRSLEEGMVITRDMREKLYGALCKLKDYEDTGLSPDEVESLNEFEESNAQKYLIEIAKHRWIPVEERLPENDNSVLMCSAAGGVDVGWWTGVRWVTGFSHADVAKNIIAWQPLPEPYRPERRKDGQAD